MSNNKDSQKDNTTSNEIGKEHGITRRKFIKNTGMIVGGVAGGSLLGGMLTNNFQAETTNSPVYEEETSTFTEARMFFTRYEDFVVLMQATERIFPEDDNGPGAIDLGVPYFIDKQLAGSWGINGSDYRKGPFPGSEPSVDTSTQTRGEIFINGLRKMNQLSHKQFGASFDDVEKNQQIDILMHFENDEVDMKGVAASDFFSLLRQMTLEGAYADPLYGGNKNMEGWKMKEFPGAVHSYEDIIENDEFIKMDPISLEDYQQG
ncbi:gluconate 2-dehydrogenase subunit 3 family protein [Salicibibacter kimchii]|uniref:Gluconate 2-dehydrogenase subunit 3 family protein n=1 Tax=Salicibibacter kimchii TaxID=2099786 RepID=A0A345C1C2_9BACI|nr:gluconate 2-dehydrogenase subunit 3 family protein [Salicibibacter kimchii]AXF57003.1 gluconate 2-dehydrogenase subunit 3 family protein [Salicibibacter kimchii]